MKLSLLSDLHFEFHMDGGYDFIKSLDNSNVDVLLLAGDIATYPLIEKTVKAFCDKYPQVVYVCGNHEYWGQRRQTITDLLQSLSYKIDNFHWLDNEVFEYNGFRFLGSTLWFRDAHPTLCADWSDFDRIKDLSEWISKQNDKSIDFLMSELRSKQPSKDIVISHHLPSEKSIDEKFANDPTNCFYLCDVEDLIVDRQPILWVHGHSHKSQNYKINSTRVVSNPLGYVGYEQNTGFNDRLIIEI